VEFNFQDVFQDVNMNMIGLFSIVLLAAGYSVFIGVSRIFFLKRLRELEVAMVRYPNYADVRAQIASLYYSHNYLIEAKRYYYEALKIYPYYHYARLKISLICFEENNYEEAMHHLKKLRVNASHDHVMIDLIVKLVKEKSLYKEYLKDDKQLDDNYFKAQAQS